MFLWHLCVTWAHLYKAACLWLSWYTSNSASYEDGNIEAVKDSMKGSLEPCGAHLASYLSQRTAVQSCIDHTSDPSEATFSLRAWSTTATLSKLKLFSSSVYNSKWKHNCFFLWVTCSSYYSCICLNPCLLSHALYFTKHPHKLQ